MDLASQNALRTSPPRPLTDDERQLLLDWKQAAQDYSAFVSERRSDEPAIYRRIVVSLRATRQHLYLIHGSTEPACWIIISIETGEYVESFPTLRAVLNYIEPVAIPDRRSARPRVQKQPATPGTRPHRGASVAKRLGIFWWVGALAGMLLVAQWLGRGSGIEQASRSAETIAEQVVQDSLGNADSTQFRNVMAYRTGPANERWVCGWFYTKNAGGVTVGPMRFVVYVLLADSDSSGGRSGSRTHLLTSESAVPSILYAWENYCR
jgi:hypothetical protein